MCFLRNSPHFFSESKQRQKLPQLASGIWAISHERGGPGGCGLPPRAPTSPSRADRTPTRRTAAAGNKPTRQQTGVRKIISQHQLGNKYPCHIKDTQLAN